MQSALKVASMLTVVVLAGCATVTMPQNVTTTPASGSQSYIGSVDFSYQSTAPRTFSQLKMCVAESVSNRSVQLHDASGSFVGAASGKYYEASHSQTVQGGGIFKYSDPAESTLIANGTADAGSVALGLTKDIIKYDLKASVRGPQVGLIFSNITRAQQSTGSVANDGFSPVGTWSGARPMQSYTALEGIANQIKSCLQ